MNNYGAHTTMAPMIIMTDFFADFGQNFIIFALEMHFQHFFPLVTMEDWVHLYPKYGIITVRMVIFILEIGTTKTFEIESRFVYFLC